MQFFSIHPENPQLRLLDRTAEILKEGGVIVYPTDSAYALGCHLGDKDALERIRRIRNLDEKHNFTLMCRDLSELSTYARFDTPTFRLLKVHTPGPYTFLLTATKEVPRRVFHPKKKTIGLRVPEHRITQMLLERFGAPLLSTTLLLPGDDLPLQDPDEIHQRLEKHVDLMLDGGFCGSEPTTIVDLTGEAPQVLRKGKGDPTPFES